MLDIEPIEGVRKGGYEQCLPMLHGIFWNAKTKKGPSDKR